MPELWARAPDATNRKLRELFAQDGNGVNRKLKELWARDGAGVNRKIFSNGFEVYASNWILNPNDQLSADVTPISSIQNGIFLGGIASVNTTVTYDWYAKGRLCIKLPDDITAPLNITSVNKYATLVYPYSSGSEEIFGDIVFYNGTVSPTEEAYVVRIPDGSPTLGGGTYMYDNALLSSIPADRTIVLEATVGHFYQFEGSGELEQGRACYWQVHSGDLLINNIPLVF